MFKLLIICVLFPVFASSCQAGYGAKLTGAHFKGLQNGAKKLHLTCTLTWHGQAWAHGRKHQPTMTRLLHDRRV